MRLIHFRRVWSELEVTKKESARERGSCLHLYGSFWRSAIKASRGNVTQETSVTYGRYSAAFLVDFSI